MCVGLYFLIPWLRTEWNTVSTDDAYVNGHVTFVAPRVSGQVPKVLVDDNYRVKLGDLLVQLDKEPYRVQVAQKQSALHGAEADLSGPPGPGAQPGGAGAAQALAAATEHGKGRRPDRQPAHDVAT